MKSIAMQQVNEFVSANDKSPVVEGSVLDLTVGGAFYELEDGSCFKLYFDECQMLAEGYPKWKL